jgi:hypothetical protein
MQAALLMNKLKAGAAVAETSKLLAAAAAAATSSTSDGTTVKSSNSISRGRPSSKNSKSKQPNLAMGDKLNKNTVASLLAKSRELSGGTKLSPEELEQAERSWSHPELTIEPIFRSLKPDQRYNLKNNNLNPAQAQYDFTLQCQLWRRI